MQSIAYIAASNGAANASLMTVQTARAVNATSILVNTVANVPPKFYATMGTPHTFTDPVTGETITIISEATAVDFAGSVSGGSLNIDAIAPGYTDAGSKVGDIIVLRPNTEYANNLKNVLAAGALNDNGTLATTALDTFYKPSEITQGNFIASGGIWSPLTGLNATMTAVVAYINGLRAAVAAVTTRTFTASKDTYVDVLLTGNVASLVYTEVANNASSPALAANSVRLCIVVTGATTVTVCNWGQLPIGTSTPLPALSSNILWSFDGNGIKIYPTSPSQKTVLLQQRITSTNTGFSSSRVGYNGYPNAYNMQLVAGRRYKITLHEANLSWTTGNNNTFIYFYINGVSVAQVMKNIVTANYQDGLDGSASFVAPITGLCNLQLQYNAGGGGGTMTIGANNGDLVSQLIVEECN